MLTTEGEKPTTPIVDGEKLDESNLARVKEVGQEDTTTESPAPGPRPVFVTKTEEEREAKRGKIAITLVWLLVGVVAATPILVATRKWTGMTTAELKDLLTV